MRSFSISLLFVVVVGILLAWAGPWWTPLVACFIFSALRGGNYKSSFLLGALGQLLVWLLPAIYLNMKDATGLSAKISSLFTESVPALSFMTGSTLSYFVLIVLALILGGLAGLSGTAMTKK